MPDFAKTHWKEIASELLKRNGSVSLCPLSIENEHYSEDLSYGSRLLGLADEHLIVEVPNLRQGYQHFETGAHIFVMLVHHTRRIELCSTVLQRVKFKVNENLQVIAYKLSPPSRAHSAQRREYYRAAVSAMRIKPLPCTPLDPTSYHPIDHQTFEAKLINLSGGGLGTLVRKENLNLLKKSNFFECDLELPQEDGLLQLHLICQAMHHTTNRQGDVYVGMQFVFKDPTLKRETVDKLVKYAVWVQREHLKHNRQ